MKPTLEQYEAQLKTMLDNAERWRKANPEKNALISFNYPPGVAVIGTIEDAIEVGAVTTNEAGLELVKALWSWDAPDMPTVLMVRAVLEFEELKPPQPKRY